MTSNIFAEQSDARLEDVIVPYRSLREDPDKATIYSPNVSVYLYSFLHIPSSNAGLFCGTSSQRNIASYSLYKIVRYNNSFKIFTCSNTALLLVPPVAFFNSTARS